MLIIRKEILRLFPTCWSITNHWWRDEQLNKLYILCYLFVSNLLELLQTILKTFRLSFTVLSIRKQLWGLFPTCWSITSHWWRDEQLNKLYILCFLFVSNLLELLTTILKTFRLSFTVLSIRKELWGLFPTCWSITSHWWRDEQLNKLYILCFLFVSNLLELLQTILKTFRLSFTVLSIRKQLWELFPTCWSITSHWWRDEQLNKLY